MAAASALAAIAGAGVHTVGATRAEFTTIASAAHSAADGDILLVKSGQYAGFTLDGKGLAIVADEGANVLIDGTVRVTHLLPSQVVVLAGLVVYGASAPAIVADSNQGAVRVEASTLRIFPNHAVTPPATVVVSDCVDVALLTVSVVGAAPSGAFASSGVALTSARARLALEGCSIQGSWGEPGTLGVQTGGGSGADGLALSSGALAIVDSVLRGGAGGAGGVAITGGPGCAGFAALPGGAGGNGVVVGGGATCRSFVSTLQGGTGGSGGTTPCGQHAADGAAGSGVVGVATQTGGIARTMSASAVVREGGVVRLELDGAPGETVFLFWSDRPGQVVREDLGGCVLVGNPFSRRVRMGVVPASGHLGVGVAVPELGASVEGVTRFVQALFVDGNGHARLGSSAVVTMLDAAF